MSMNETGILWLQAHTFQNGTSSENKIAPKISFTLIGPAPSFCLPPVEFCRGTSTTQAAKSRSDRNAFGSVTTAVIHGRQ